MTKLAPVSVRSWPQAIVHIDGDSFFASCEQAMHTEYKGQPLVVGGERSAGYRGFSLKRNVFPGRWRVSVETSSGYAIRRSTFPIIAADSVRRKPAITTHIW
jgi:hypothetical protein